MNVPSLCVLCFQGGPNTEHTMIMQNELCTLPNICSNNSYQTSGLVLQYYFLMQFNLILIYSCFNYINYVTEH